MSAIISGTVSVTAGSTAVTAWSGTPLDDINLPVGSIVSIQGMSNIVAARVSTTAFTLQVAHQGAGGGALASVITANTPEEISIGKANRSLATAMQQITALDANGQGLFFNLLSTTGANDPGPGNMAFNNATPASVTEIYLDNLDANTNQEDVSALIGLWATDTVLTVRSLATSAYISVKLTGAPTDMTGWQKCAVSYVGSSGTLGVEACAVEWNRGGAVGTPAGVNYLWDTGVTAADPGAGNIRANNATVVNATKLFIDDLETNGADVSAWLDSWDDSTNAVGGTIVLASETSPATFYIFNVTGAVVNSTGYRDVTVTYVAGQGTLTAGESLFLMFSRTGNDGAGTGDLISTNNLSDVASAPTALTNLGAVAKAGDTMTGALLMPGGSLAAPALSLSGDADTGIYSPGANQLDLVTGGVKALGIDGSGYMSLPKIPSFQMALGNSVLSGTFILLLGTAAGHSSVSPIDNNGSHFSTTTGRFTAPVAGRYFFSVSGGHNDNAATGWFMMYKNGATMLSTVFNYYNRWDYAGVSAVLSMAAGDYVEMKYNLTSTAATFYGGNMTGFKVG